MKNRLSFVVVVGLFASCATGPRDVRDRLVGEWRYADKAMSCQYVLSSDGSFHGEATVDARPISKFTGRWFVEGDTLVYRYTGDALKSIPVGSVDRDKLIKVERNAVTIEAADGSRRRYLRVR